MRVSFNKVSLFTAGLAAAAVSLSAFAVACGDDSKPQSNDPGKQPGPDGTAPSEAPLYAVVTLPETSGGAPQTSYVMLTDTLKANLKLESAALEIPGRAIAAGPNGSRTLFVGTNTSGKLTRYTLGEGGKLSANGTVNFEAQQVPNFTAYSAYFQFIQPNKAYFFAANAAKIVIWDPEQLIITGSIPLPAIVRKDPANPATSYTTTFTGAPIRSGDKLYSFVSWDTRAGTTIKVPAASAVVVVDTAADTAEVIVDEGVCGFARDGVLVGDWLYVATEGAAASVHYLNAANSPAPCLRRFNVKTKTFDPAFKVDLNGLAGGAPVGSMVVSPGGTALVHVLDKATADPQIAQGAISNPRVLSNAALWKTARLTIGDAPSLELLGGPLTSASVLPVTLKDGLKVTATFDSAPHLYEVTNNGVVGTDRVNATTVGSTMAIVQLR
ncbi:hypothetical protein [Pendulispora albinea]|uniref:Uncharacterized protein n=1 Tax=Pendulispora albinea TaxID=2741071 RepID=A0ABZ2LM93_9BACT